MICSTSAPLFCRRFSLWLRRREISPRLFIFSLFVVVAVVTKAHWIIVLLHFKQTSIDSSLCFQRASEALCSIKKQSFVAERLTNSVVELKHSLLFFNFTQNDKTWNPRNETAEKKCEKNFAKDYVRRSGSKLNCSNDKVSAFSAVHKKPVFPSALCEVVSNFPPKRIFSMPGPMRGKCRNNYQKLIIFDCPTVRTNVDAVYLKFLRKSTITQKICIIRRIKIVSKWDRSIDYSINVIQNWHNQPKIESLRLC